MLDAEFAQERLWGPPDWGSLGLVLCLAGGFLLAHGTLVRDPQTLVEERFGSQRADLRSLRSMLFHRVQTLLGFGLLLLGFAAQLYARAVPQAGGSVGSAALWTGAVVLAAALLELSAWWWSLVTVRRHLRAWFRQHPPDFDRDPGLAREVGDLFAIDSLRDEAVQSYADRLRRELGLSAPRAAPSRRAAVHVDEPAEENSEN
ncbi:MAG TPA: hypothetical protein VK843_05200 [Planctomycetota bacterium]|nr:hypothetical protein [Planctomycetota bacterium]